MEDNVREFFNIGKSSSIHKQIQIFNSSKSSYKLKGYFVEYFGMFEIYGKWIFDREEYRKFVMEDCFSNRMIFNFIILGTSFGLEPLRRTVIALVAGLALTFRKITSLPLTIWKEKDGLL